MPTPPARSRRFHVGLVVAAFFALRTLLWATGLRFQDHLVGQLQLIDEPLLRDDPFRAFTSLHTQPPLWNFFVGSVRRWSPLPDAFTFQLVWLVVDLATVLMLWAILRRLGARRWQATVASILVASNPLFVLAGSTLRYEPAVTFIVTASVYTFARFTSTGRSRFFVAFVVLLGVGVGTRTLLQIFWLIGGIVAIILVARRLGRLRPRLIAAAFAVACLIGVDLVFVHHRFDTWGYSSHAGSNLKRIAITTLPADRLDELIGNGTVSPNARIKPFSPYDDYDPPESRCTPTRTDPALARATKSTGEPNLNYECFLPLYRQDLSDSLAAIRAEPWNYAQRVGQATVLFASWPIGFDDTETRSFDVLVQLYRPLLLPVYVDHSFGGDDPQGVARVFGNGLGDLPLLLTVVAGLGLGLGRGIVAAWRIIGRHGHRADAIQVWIGFTIAVVVVTGVPFDIYENARFRQAIDPIVLGPMFVAVLAAGTAASTRLATRLGLGRSHVPGPSTTASPHAGPTPPQPLEHEHPERTEQ